LFSSRGEEEDYCIARKIMSKRREEDEKAEENLH
jgi:hypothetical protein